MMIVILKGVSAHLTLFNLCKLLLVGVLVLHCRCSASAGTSLLDGGIGRFAFERHTLEDIPGHSSAVLTRCNAAHTATMAGMAVHGMMIIMMIDAWEGGGGGCGGGDGGCGGDGVLWWWWW